MNDQDRRAVENMCITGMDLEGLYACFPAFSKEQIEKIYAHVEAEKNTKSAAVTKCDQYRKLECEG